jgi:transposase-like protein
MRYPASEKLEIIRLVEQSHLPVRRTLEKLGILPGSFYRWVDRYQTGGVEALEDKPSKPSRVWNNHSDAYSFLGGIHVNGAESYFSRLRRMIRGQHHRVGAGRLGGYAAHAAWLEDHRRQSNGALVAQPIGNGLSAPVSRLWKGYWRRAE